MTRRSRAVVVAVAIAGVAAFALTRPPSPAGSALRPARQVVLVGLPGLRLDDLRSGALPNLDALVARGALGAMASQTVSAHPSSAELYTSLGAGGVAQVDPAAGAAYGPGDAVDGLEGAGTAADALGRASGSRPRGEVLVVDAPALRRRNEGKHRASFPGALGDALADAGRRAAVVGNADTPGALGALGGLGGRDVYRPAAAAVMTTGGEVAAGTVERADLLRPDADAAFGWSADTARVVSRAVAAMAEADVTVVDPGDLDRLAALVPPPDPARAAELRRAALRRADELVGALAAAAPPGALLAVTGFDAGPGERSLAPVVLAGDGIGAGLVVSPSTGRLGVLTLADLAPTVLHVLGVAVPAGMVGQPLRSASGSDRLGYLERLDRGARFREVVQARAANGFITAELVFYAFALLCLSRWGRLERSGALLRAGALALAAFPLATLLLRLVPGAASLGAAGLGPLVALDVAVALVAGRLRATAWQPVVAVYAATVALVLVDLCTGSRLQLSSVLGNSLLVAARFRGIGNAGLGVVVGTLLVVTAGWLARARDRRVALRLVGGLFALTVLVVGLPFFGAKVGGVLVLVPVLGLAWIRLGGHRLSWRVVVAAGVGAIVVLGTVTAVDLLQPGRSRSHLGRLAGSTEQTGVGALGTTVARKLTTAVRVAGGSHWTLAAAGVGLFVIVLLWPLDGLADVVPRGSDRRVALVAVLGAAGLGVAVNDSGILVAALALATVAPWLVVLAVEARSGARTHTGVQPSAGE